MARAGSSAAAALHDHHGSRPADGAARGAASSPRETAAPSPYGGFLLPSGSASHHNQPTTPMTTTAKPRARGKKAYDGPTPEEKLCADLVALLEQGAPKWRRPWQGQAGRHRNLITGAE
ncbi:MAG: hypothetical protein ACKO45_05520, partial [Cyanobium sp.]